MMEDKKIFDNWEKFKSLLKKTNREGIDNIIDWLDKSDFKIAPASTQYHNSEKGGLLQHSLNVYNHMYDFENLINFFDLKEDTIILTSLLHDVCKVHMYEVSYRNAKNEQGQWVKVPYYSVNDQIPYGHGEKSVMLLQYYGLKLSLVEIMMIRSHMGSFRDNQYLNDVSHRFSKCPQSIVLHFADMLSTYTTESPDLQNRYKEKLIGYNITNCLEELNKPRTIQIDGMEYKLAPEDAEVDNVKVIEMMVANGEHTYKYKVYAPHADGLPF